MYTREINPEITKNYLQLPKFICDNRKKSFDTYYKQGSWFPTWETLMLEGCTDETDCLISNVKVPVNLFHGTADKIVNIKVRTKLLKTIEVMLPNNLFPISFLDPSL